MATNPQVDSRAYAFAYVIRKPADFPADFQVPETRHGFVIALFLPQDQAGVFSQSAYPARILVLFSTSLVLATHPSANRSERWIPLDSLLWVELGQFLLDGRLTLRTVAGPHPLRFNTRDGKAIEEFLTALRAIAMPALVEGATESQSLYGVPLDLKFMHAERADLDDDEHILVRFFSSPLQHRRHGLLFQRVTWESGNYLAVTNRRIVWLTDRNDDQRDAYGVMAKYAGVRRLESVEFNAADNGGTIDLSFRSLGRWSVPIRQGANEDAERFVARCRIVLSALPV